MCEDQTTGVRWLKRQVGPDRTPQGGTITESLRDESRSVFTGISAPDKDSHPDTTMSDFVPLREVGPDRTIR